MERTDQIIELISKANQSFDSGVIRDGQKLTREALKLVKIQVKFLISSNISLMQQ